MIAAELAKALGGRPVGRDWFARCPAHDDRSPSLAIRDTLPAAGRPAEVSFGAMTSTTGEAAPARRSAPPFTGRLT
jgi:hypothetical protein